MHKNNYDEMSLSSLQRVKDSINEKCERDMSYWAENHEAIASEFARIDKAIQFRKVKEYQH